MRVISLLVVLAAISAISQVDAGLELANVNGTNKKCEDCPLKWQREQFDSHKCPYGGLCLGFVHDAEAHCGYHHDYLDQPSAHAAALMASKEAGWHAFSDYNIPRGAVILWLHCGNQPYGHACLSDGSGYASSSGDCQDWNGGPHQHISWLKSWCGADPAGWIMPC